MITNDYSQELLVPEEFVLPTRSYHKFYVKRSKFKHVLFALFVVALLVFAGIFLNSVV